MSPEDEFIVSKGVSLMTARFSCEEKGIFYDLLFAVQRGANAAKWKWPEVAETNIKGIEMDLVNLKFSWNLRKIFTYITATSCQDLISRSDSFFYFEIEEKISAL